MQVLKYERGEFSQDDSLPDGDENTEWDEWIKFAGFSPYGTQMGLEFGGHLTIHESRNGKTYLIEVSVTGNDCELIHITDYPSILMFLRDFGTIFQLAAIREDVCDLQRMMEKTFRKYHGHGFREVCDECAPDEMNRRREEYAEEKARKTPNGGKAGNNE